MTGAGLGRSLRSRESWARISSGAVL